MKRLPPWTWTVWVLAVALSFAALETLGLLTAAEGDTLSEWTRAVLGIDPVKPWRIAGSAGFAAVLLGFTAWFGPHILFRWGWWQPFKRNDDERETALGEALLEVSEPPTDPAYPPVSDPKSPQVSDLPNPPRETL